MCACMYGIPCGRRSSQFRFSIFEIGAISHPPHRVAFERMSTDPDPNGANACPSDAVLASLRGPKRSSKHQRDGGVNNIAGLVQAAGRRGFQRSIQKLRAVLRACHTSVSFCNNIGSHRGGGGRRKRSSWFLRRLGGRACRGGRGGEGGRPRKKAGFQPTANLRSCVSEFEKEPNPKIPPTRTRKPGKKLRHTELPSLGHALKPIKRGRRIQQRGENGFLVEAWRENL